MRRTAVADSIPDTEERILRAALETFAERGYDGASMRDIAARADATLGLLQYYFGGKARLWRAAVDRAFAEMRSGFDAALADTELLEDREKLRRMIHAHTRFAARNPEFIRLMHDEGKRRGPRTRWIVDRHVKPMFEPMVSLVARAQERGLLRDDVDPVHFVYIFVGAIGVIFHQTEECKRVAGIDPMEEKAVAAHARAVESLFLGPPPQENSE